MGEVRLYERKYWWLHRRNTSNQCEIQCVLKHAYLKYKYFTKQRFKKYFNFISNTLDIDNWSLVFICYRPY